MSTVIVSGAIANKPFNGGAAWTRLNWALGFRRLGWTVYFVEQLHEAAEHTEHLTYFRQIMEAFGLSQTSALLNHEGCVIVGPSEAELLAVAEGAELLINITGHLRHEPLLRRIGYKVYVDLDPGFTQFWHADPQSAFRLQDHDAYFTVGENIGTRECSIPTDGIRWRPTRQPVVLEEWPAVDGCVGERFTTVGSWRGPYGPVEAGGRTFGLKVHEFRKFLELPQRCGRAFELALDIHPADGKDLERLRRHGWTVVDPKVVAGDPERFRRYVQGSRAEFSVAQGVYVETNSGWFSDRTARYLASGKPALVQDTGFSRTLPVGEGLLAFRTLDEAVAGAEAIARDYARHSRAARAIAEAHFDSDKVLGRLLEEVGVSA